MDDLCASCLCTGRKLNLIGDTDVFNLYAQILNEIPVYSLSEFTIRVCWECKARLQRFDTFKAQVKRNYTELLLYVQQNSSRPSQEPSLRVHRLEGVVLPLEPLIKEELHDDIVDHNELETFVKDLPQTGKKGRVKCKEKPKKKIKRQKEIKKLKVKKLEPTPELSDTEPTDHGDDAEPCHDETDQPDCKHTDVIDNTIDEKPAKMEDKVPVKMPSLGPPERPQCLECGKLFSSKKTFRYHWNVLHKGQNQYPCGRCGKVYQWKSNLGRHMRTHKAVDLDELYCATCDKRFASIATYKQHLRISRRHVSETDFTFMCNECGKKFVNKTGLRDHIDWEHLHKVKFRCQLCTKPFKCRPSLYIHMQNVHRDKDKKDNLCHVCGKSYQNSAKLKYHIVAMHTSATPYQCPQCSAAFGWYSSLYRHVREVHYKMKLQNKKSKKLKKDVVPPLIPPPFHQPAS